MNTAIISIGSNENSEVNINLCKKLLSEIFDNIYFSNISITKPFGKHYKNDFLNQLALIKTDSNLEHLNICLKAMEKKMGRNGNDKINGSVKIDIDIVKWNDIILKENDWNRNYVADLLPSLYENINPEL